MLDYIWLDDKSPIVKQIPRNFKSAAILLHPFIQMPLRWEQNKRKNEYEHIYPTDEEILLSGKPVSWETMIHQSGLENLEELAIALKTSTGALRGKYAREDLAEELNSSIKSDLYYPYEDFPTVFLITDLLDVLSSKGATQLSYSDPLLDKSGVLEIKNINPLEAGELSLNELMITDENMDFAFMNVFDSFITIIMLKDDNINDIVKSKNWEAIVCDKNTYVNWYSKAN
ncbi:DUF2711 family protein [Oceanobacillus chungangensis]|uniref:DUF2711 domain-containing protein n=1 Tax=Oceanobacillus chungangensis TaxID=1229152 RepID=A0A3D8PI92_9BACI|nr:DUF2711 family protein [Oceanobacillus chungangensis]RDW14949.1 DUF2711 domain-containing protein [Oceanobacillus chungangensis]